VLESGFGCFLSVEDGVPSSTFRSPEAVVTRAVANDVFAGNVVAVVVQ